MKVGIVVGNSNIQNFEFIVDPNFFGKIKVGDIVKIPVDDTFAFGIIVDLYVKGEDVLSIVSDYKTVEFLFERIEKVEKILVGKVEILGKKENNKLVRLSFPPLPGTKVYLPDKKEIEEIYGKGEEWESIYIGSLKGSREEISPPINLKEILIKHLAIFGTTGSGKSHTVAVIGKEVIKHNLPLVIFDVHRDYIPTFKNPIIITFDEKDKKLLKNINVEHNLNSEPKVFVVKIGIREINFELLSEVLGITEKMSKLYALLRLVYDCNPNLLSDVKTILKDPKFKQQALKYFEDIRDYDNTVSRLLLRFSRLSHWKIIARTSEEGKYNFIDELLKFGTENEEIIQFEDIEAEEVSGIIKPGVPIIIDLYPLSLEEQRVVINLIITKFFSFWKKLKESNRILPIVFIVEEAHRFASKDTKVAKMLGTIAREGRKFGMGLWIVSQIPSKIVDDVISQMNTFIFLRLTNPKDLNYIKSSCPYLTEDYLKALTRLERGEALVVGLGIRYPAMIKIRGENIIIGGSEKQIEESIKRLYYKQ